jgi:hypothetical protein
MLKVLAARVLYRRHWMAAGMACLPLCVTALAAGFSPASVAFAPAVEAALQSKYGAPEPAALRAIVVDRLSAALKAAGGKCNLALDVVIERATPSHPTMSQQFNDPALDPIRTVFNDGGAALTGHVRGADGRELATVRYERFNDDLRLTSASKAPWSDARVSIDQFAHMLVAECKRKTSAANPAG